MTVHVEDGDEQEVRAVEERAKKPPESAPPGATDSHAGPAVQVKTSVSPASGSVAASSPAKASSSVAAKSDVSTWKKGGW